MKNLQNPTTFFFKQAEQITGTPSQQIQDFVSKLISNDHCQLCKQKYDLLLKIPRIMVHCGHTFCTPCLKQFYVNRRVRCPMCLKLVKQIDKIQRLPINHTIFTHLVEIDKKHCEKLKLKPVVMDAEQHLFTQFQKTIKEALMNEKPQKIDPESGLPFCVLHPDRVEHFYCAVHSSAGCRVCSQVGHSKAECKVIDLYEIDDPNQLAQMVGKSTNEEMLNDSEQRLGIKKEINLDDLQQTHFVLDDEDDEDEDEEEEDEEDDD